MIVYTCEAGGRYIPVAESLRERPEGKRSVYVNLTNRCTCSCTFCLRSMKKMAETQTLWLKEEPTVAEVKAQLDGLPWNMVQEMKYVKETHPDVKTRLNTNGLSDLAYKRDTAPDFGGGILDTISISMNASNKERYLELTRSQFGIPSYDAMLQFAQHCKQYVPNVVLTVVDHVEDSEEIRKCRAICQEKGLHLRVRVYEDS